MDEKESMRAYARSFFEWYINATDEQREQAEIALDAIVADFWQKVRDAMERDT